MQMIGFATMLHWLSSWSWQNCRNATRHKVIKYWKQSYLFNAFTESAKWPAVYDLLFRLFLFWSRPKYKSIHSFA